MSEEAKPLSTASNAAPSKTASIGIAGAGAAAGVGAGALLMAVLNNYPGVIPQILNWGPAIFVIAGIGWFANQHAPRFMASQELIGSSLQSLAATVERNSDHQQDLVLATQVNSDKIDRMGALLTDMKQSMERRRVTDAR